MNKLRPLAFRTSRKALLTNGMPGKTDKPSRSQKPTLARALAGQKAVKTPKVIHNSGEVEWYTPKPIISAAREAMGAIDMDPASSRDANLEVQARRFYDQSENGLGRPWGRRVWLNPPYSRVLVKAFTESLLEKLETGEVTQACVLVNNATETRWFQSILRKSSAVCFLAGRLKFIDKNGVCPGAPLQGQVVLFFGESVAAFTRAFEPFGIVMAQIPPFPKA